MLISSWCQSKWGEAVVTGARVDLLFTLQRIFESLLLEILSSVLVQVFFQLIMALQAE